MEGRKKEKRIMPNLVAAMSASARTPLGPINMRIAIIGSTLVFGISELLCKFEFNTMQVTISVCAAGPYNWKIFEITENQQI